MWSTDIGFYQSVAQFVTESDIIGNWIGNCPWLAGNLKNLNKNNNFNHLSTFCFFLQVKLRDLQNTNTRRVSYNGKSFETSRSFASYSHQINHFDFHYSCKPFKTLEIFGIWGMTLPWPNTWQKLKDNAGIPSIHLFTQDIHFQRNFTSVLFHFAKKKNAIKFCHLLISFYQKIPKLTLMEKM